MSRDSRGIREQTSNEVRATWYKFYRWARRAMAEWAVTMSTDATWQHMMATRTQMHHLERMNRTREPQC